MAVALEPGRAPELDALFTKQEAREYLQVSRGTLDRLIYGAEIDVVRVGVGRGTVRITGRALRDYTERRTTRATENRPRGTR